MLLIEFRLVGLHYGLQQVRFGVELFIGCAIYSSCVVWGRRHCSSQFFLQKETSPIEVSCLLSHRFLYLNKNKNHERS